MINDSEKYKKGAQKVWDEAAAGWNQWVSAISQWLDPATEEMLNLTDIKPGFRVLDEAPGAGGRNSRIEA